MRSSLIGAALILAAVSLHAQERDGASTKANPSPVPPDAETRELRPRDKLHYRVDEDPSRGAESMTVEVTDLYKAQFKVSRGYDKAIVLDVKGKKLPTVRDEVKRRLENEFYNHATVSIELAEVGNRNTLLGGGAKAVFMGEVRGTVPIPEGQKVMLSEAILHLTYSDWANLKKVEILRKDESGKALAPIRVDVDAIIRNNRIDLDVELKDGDRVKVPQRLFKSFTN
jgi:hypothetical protein